MPVERFYHSAPSAAAVSTAESVRALSTAGGDFALPATAFPQGLEAAAYALKKRVVCPHWWVIGVMSQWLQKDSDQLALQVGLKEGDWILSGPNIPVKSFLTVVSLWTEIFAQLSRCDESGSVTLELELSRLLKGTSSELLAQREFLIEYLSSALRVYRARFTPLKTSSKRSKSLSASSGLSLEPVGVVQMVENVVLKNGTAATLLVTFARDPRRLFMLASEELLPAAMKTNATEQAHVARGLTGTEQSIVSLQPDILQALSRAVSPKKLCSYLALEISKKTATVKTSVALDDNDVWRGRALASKELSKLHKDQLARAQSFYDHGLLSWENEAPRQRVRSLVGHSPQMADSGIVHCWRMSQHAMDAVQFENALSGALRRGAASALELAVSEDKKVLSAISPTVVPSPVVPSAGVSSGTSPSVVAAAGVTSAHMVATSTRLSQSASSMPTFSVQRSERVIPSAGGTVSEREPSGHVLSAGMTSDSNFVSSSARSESLNDDEFLMCVAEFYESLTPLQQQAFERERRKMSPEQFKKYVTPVLMRLRARTGI